MRIQAFFTKNLARTVYYWWSFALGWCEHYPLKIHGKRHHIGRSSSRPCNARLCAHSNRIKLGWISHSRSKCILRICLKLTMVQLGWHHGWCSCKAVKRCRVTCWPHSGRSIRRHYEYSLQSLVCVWTINRQLCIWTHFHDTWHRLLLHGDEVYHM